MIAAVSGDHHTVQCKPHSGPVWGDVDGQHLGGARNGSSAWLKGANSAKSFAKVSVVNFKVFQAVYA